LSAATEGAASTTVVNRINNSAHQCTISAGQFGGCNLFVSFFGTSGGQGSRHQPPLAGGAVVTNRPWRAGQSSPAAPGGRGRWSPATPTIDTTSAA